MQTFEIIDGVTGAVLRTATVDLTIRPVLRDGEEARLTHVDGEPAIQGEELQLTDEERARMPKLEALNSGEPLGYAVGISGVGTRPDDAHPGVQLEPAEGAEPIAAASERHAE